MGATSRAYGSRGGLIAAAIAVCLAGCGSSSSSQPGSGSTSHTAVITTTTNAGAAASQLGPERMPLERGAALAPASTTSPGTTVDGIQCAPIEQLAYHIHAHLQVYVDGHPRSLPGAIGLVKPLADQTPVGPFYGAQQCYYWLHTHTSDGVIHIESPTVRIYTLGDFFDEWRQPLGRTRVASAQGKVIAFLNGHRWLRDPRQIPLLPHAAIQLDVGAPTVPFVGVSWAGTAL